MTETPMTQSTDKPGGTDSGAPGAELPQGEVFTRGRLSIVWLIPLISLLVGGWLAYKLQTGSLITGQLYVELGLHPTAPPASITEEQGYKAVPTVPAPLEAITGKVDNLLDTLDELPLDKIERNVLALAEGANRLVNSQEVASSAAALSRALAKIDRQVVPEVAAALHQARATLQALQGLTARDSSMVGELRKMLRRLTAAARPVDELADYLARHPEALLEGKRAICG